MARRAIRMRVEVLAPSGLGVGLVSGAGPYAAGVTAGAVVARLLEAKRGNRIVAKVARHFISQAPVLT